MVQAPNISSFTAGDAAASVGYSINDTLTITFSDNTDLAGYSINAILPKSQVDSLFSFSGGVILGGDYNGQWIDRKTFVITIVDPSTANPPQIGSTQVSVNANALLRGYPFSELSTTSTSPALSGNFDGKLLFS